MIKTINSIFVFIVTWIWASIYWINDVHLSWSMVATYEVKPFVYRQLIPVLVRGLVGLGFRVDIAIIVMVSLSGVFFYLTLSDLLYLFYGKSTLIDTASLIFVLLGLILFSEYRMPYDLATAGLFTLSFLFIYKGEISKFFWLFPLTVLNRETSFLLIILYFVIVGFRLLDITYLMSVFGSIQLFLRLVFWDNLGSSVWIEPYKNLMKFIHSPERTILHLIVFSVILWLIFHNWKNKPNIKWGFLWLAICLVPMYLVLGQAFEVRVFWEIYPLIVVLSMSTIKEFYNEKVQVRKSKEVQPLQPAQNILPD